MYAFCSRSSRSSSASRSAGLAAMNAACSRCRMSARKICCSRSSYVSLTINAMKAPTWAAFAPGVLVSGRIVSATSSSKATSCALKVPAPAPAAATPRPPASATPPSSAVTRRIASRRSIMASLAPVIDLSLRLQVVALELTHGKVRRARRERHVRERRVLARRRYHTGAVRDEDVGRVPHLVVRVEHRRLGIATHPRRPHLVEPHPREALVVIGLDALHARRLERLGHVVHHVPPHQALVLAGRTVDREDGQPPLVFLGCVDRDTVRMVGEHLPEGRGSDAPRARLGHGILERTAHPQLGHRARPPLTAGAPLVADAPQVRPLVAEQIAVARDVEAGGSPAIVILVIEPFDRTLRTHTKVMIHQVVPQLSGARPQPVGPHLRRGA